MNILRTAFAGALFLASATSAFVAQAADFITIQLKDGPVVIELELSMAGVVGDAKVISRPSAFDAAALSTVRSWRFGIPAKPSGAESIYVYAVVGFREPITGLW